MKQEKKPYLLRQVYDKIYPDGARGSTRYLAMRALKLALNPFIIKENSTETKEVYLLSPEDLIKISAKFEIIGYQKNN